MRWLTSLLLLAVNSTLLLAQQPTETKSTTDNIDITICQPKISKGGRAAYFQITLIYLLQTDAKGGVESLKWLANDDTKQRFGRLLEMEQLEECLLAWQLAPSRRYTVAIGAGTTGQRKSQQLYDNLTRQMTKIFFTPE